MIQPIYGAFSNTQFKRQEVRVRAEGSFSQNEQIKKPISVLANAYLTACEEEADKTIVKAKVIFTMVYLSEDGYKKVTTESQSTAEFSLNNLAVSVSAIDVRLTGNNYGVSCYLLFKGEQRVSVEHNALVGGDGIFVNAKEQIYDVYYNNRKGQQVVTDEFELDFTIGEVLHYGATAYINTATCGLGKIILEGEVLLTVKALPFSENNDIVKEVRVIPFRYELDDQDSLPNMKALSTVEVVTTNLKIYSDEAKDKSAITVDITLSFCANSVGENQITLAKDCYLKESECEILVGKTEIEKYLGQKCISEKLFAKGGNALDGGRIIATLSDGLTVIGVKPQDGRVVIDGTLFADVVFKNSDNGISTVFSECPYSFELCEEDNFSLISVVLCDLTARVRNGEIEFEAKVKVNYKTSNKEVVEYVEEVEELEKRKSLGGAICVCIPNEGDGLWEVSKQLGIDGEQLLKYNPNLEFPLSGEERIIIYKQKD